MPNRDVLSRFEDKIMPEPNSGCWHWIGALVSKGYGGFWHDGKLWRAHRFSYEIANGAIPDGLFVLHRCDTMCCVNPDHLFLGTHIENMLDRKRKGRGQGRNQLSKKDVGHIRAMQGSSSQKEIAEMFGVTQTTISRIFSGARWGKIKGE